MKGKGGRRKGGGKMEGRKERGRKEEGRKKREGLDILGGSPTEGTFLCVHAPSPFWLCSAVTHPAQVMGGKTENMTRPPRVPDVQKGVRAQLSGGWR